MTEQEEICGAPTQEGNKCQNPGRESCPWHNEQGERTEKSPGRKSKFDDVKKDLLQAAKNGTTKEGCARAAGIDKSTLYTWLDERPEFSDEFRRARAKGEEKLVKKVLDRKPEFILERSYGYTKKQEIEHGGVVGTVEDPIDKLREMYEGETGLKVEKEDE